LLRELEPDHVRVLYRELLDGGAKGGKPLSIASVQGVHRVLHKAFGDAVADGLLYRNPLDRVKRPVPDRRPEMRVWDAADAVKFLQAIEHERLYAMWFLFLATGMRRGEVAGLRWSDVNLLAGQIAVRNQRTTVDYRVVVNDPKTAGSAATVAIDADVIEALRQHRRRQKEERLLGGEAWQETGFVFVHPDGRPYHPQHITRMCGKIAASAGVPPISPHRLRHTCASLLLEAGVPLKVVQERLRHASYATTADLYSHVSSGMQQEAARAIESVLHPGSRRPNNSR
jgi:integrase